ncbi:hypothetical protein GCM10023149_17450 [Mucilaginibacter gynuensis]|uniref:Carboxypeptidase-like protein n=1 Tax=Mucilaginibacter gynuensis TaxID=1302236 RepID=A0ABP8G7V1_9SPHI
MARLGRHIGIICLLLCSVAIAHTGFAQTLVSGKVTRMDSKTPIENASVFLNNATFGTSTITDGAYALKNVKPGQYQLVVSCVGFEEHVQTIMVGNEPLKVDIQMMPKVTELRGVVVSTPADWKRNYELFKKDFIGTSENSKKCTVVNPHVVSLIYRKSKLLLEAYSEEFLVVENRALGYRVKYLIRDFKSDKMSGIISYEGRALFEDLKGSEHQKKEWKAKRDEAYYGSPKHFYRALYTNRLNEEGFQVLNFSRQLNPRRPPEELLQKMLRKFANNRDSLNYWGGLGNESRYYKENLQRVPLSSLAICFKTENPGIFALSFQRLLYVIYTKKHEETYFKDFYRPLDMENFEASVITPYEPYVFFDMNGTVIKNAPLYEGTWSKAKLAELLPVDYVPDEPAKTDIN